MQNNKKKKFRSLTITLVFAFLALILIIIIISSSLNVYFRLQTQEKIIDGQQQLIANKAADDVSNYIQDKFNKLESEVKLGDLGIVSQEEEELSMKKLLGMEPAFRQLILLNTQGQESVKISRLSSFASTELTEMIKDPFFLETSKEKRYISSIYIDNVTSEPLVLMSIPVKDLFNDFKGVLVAELNLKFMWDLVDRIKVGDTGVAYVVDMEGDLIAFGDTSRVLKRENLVHLDEIYEFAFGNESIHESKSEISKGILGNDVVTTHVHLGSPDWAVVVELPVEEAYEDVNQEISLSVLVLFLCIILAILISIYLSKRITNPIKKLRDATNEAAEGNLDIQINIKSNDECGELASAFNHMIVSLKKSKEEIENYSKTLEKKVSERTKELEKSKNKLDEKVIELERSKSALLNIMKDLEKAQKELEILNVGLEQKVKERTAEVENLLKQKDEFINQLSHDLRTPLTPLTNILPLLEKTEKDPKSKELFGVLRRSINRMKNVVIKTLKLAELNAPSTMFDLKDINLWEEVENSIKDQQLICDEKKFIVKNKIDENIFIKADKLRLSEVFGNLISNAVKYSPPGGTITIDAHDDEDFVNVSVMDTGIGMTTDQIDHVFDEFYKADKSRHDLESSGLGLSICKRIVERHGGRIWAESSGLGAGCTFYFTIPIGSRINKIYVSEEITNGI